MTVPGISNVATATTHSTSTFDLCLTFCSATKTNVTSRSFLWPTKQKELHHQSHFFVLGSWRVWHKIHHQKCIYPLHSWMHPSCAGPWLPREKGIFTRLNWSRKGHTLTLHCTERPELIIWWRNFLLWGDSNNCTTNISIDGTYLLSLMLQKCDLKKKNPL